MTIVETMVAASILAAGVLGVFVMIQVADTLNRTNRGRETATALARELLEDARSTPFQTIGTSNWFNQTLTDLDGRTGNVVSPTGNSARTSVDRRGVSFTVDVATCSVDDARDGYGAHSGGIAWCSDSSTVGTGDGQPEDLKRVATTISWTENSKTYSIYQTATFGSTGQVVGPTLSDFTITSPTGLDQNAPVITSNPQSGNVTFQATATGAADMKFSVDGVEQASGVSGGNGTWTFNWNITTLKDGTYDVAATAVDSLGTRGTAVVKQVKLARGAPNPVTNVTGGYNDVYVSGVKTRVVELGWDASPEGSVTGYEVWKGSTLVCAASLALECMDRSAATSGSTTYTIKTLYTDAGGNSGSVSTTYSVTAPSGSSTTTLPSTWGLVSTRNNTLPGTNCDNTGTFEQDLSSTYPTTGGIGLIFTGSSVAMCMPLFTSSVSMAAGTITGKAYFVNTSANKSCTSANGYFYWAHSSTVFGTLAGPIALSSSIPANTATPILRTFSATVATKTFQTGDQIYWWQNVTAQNGCGSVGLSYNGSYPTTLTLPTLTSSGSGPGAITRPNPPTGLGGVANGDGTTTLTWTAPTGTPAAEFYRIYRDGQNYTERYDTAGDTGSGTITWTDTNAGGTTHVYRVTAASTVMAESDFAGPITR